MKRMYHAPRCPFCDYELVTVWERQESTFHFSDAGGFYEADMRADFIQATCPHCNTDISQLFEDGVYNYQAPKVEEQPNHQAPNYGVEQEQKAEFPELQF